MSQHPPQAPLAAREGGCLCGALRYRVERGAELCVYCCHCQDCQRLSSSAFAVCMLLPSAALSLVQGEPRRTDRRADSGREIHGFFCGACGTRLYDTFPAFPDITVLKAGTLDDTAWLTPVAQFWTSRRRPWVELPPGQLEDSRQPEGFEEVIAAYRARRDPRMGGGAS